MLGKVAIAIPCRNTFYLLEQNIPKILKAIEGYEKYINIYIFDNSDDELIEQLYYKIKSKNMYYFKSKEVLTADENFLRCYSIPDVEYIWLLGDGFYFYKEDLEKVIKYLKKEKYDYLIFKGYRNIERPITNKEYNNPNEFFIELAWHATLAGSTILKKELINYILEKKSYMKYLNSNFIQLGVLLEGIIKYNKGFYLNEKIIHSNLNKKTSSWHNRVFEVFGIGWINFINSLPDQYSNSLKRKVIKMHGIKSRFFKPLNLLNLRRKNNISSVDYKNYKKIFLEITDTNLIFFKLICYMPIKLAKINFLIGLNLNRVGRVLKNPKLLKKYIDKE